MDLDYLKLQSCIWDTEFKFLVKSNQKISIQFNKLEINDFILNDFIMEFENPFNEWAMIWDNQSKSWKDHPEKNTPFTNKITAFNAKYLVGSLKFSFGGQHKLGWSRWGFSAEKLELKVDQEFKF